MEKKRVTVRIAGKDYILTTVDSEDSVRRVAQMVDQRMTELAVVTKLPVADTAVLTAMNLSDDLLKAEDENLRLRTQLENVQSELAFLKKTQEENA